MDPEPALVGVVESGLTGHLDALDIKMHSGRTSVEGANEKGAMKVARDFMELHRVHWPEFEGECEVRAVEGS